MSEKHVQNNETMWNKTAAPAVQSGSARLPYNSTMGTTPTTSAALIANENGPAFSAAARFQAPPLYQQHAFSSTILPTGLPSHMTATAAAPSTSTLAHHQHHHHHLHNTPPSIASSNVPVFSSAGAATSVLTPNPFATSGTPAAQTTPGPLAIKFFHAMNTNSSAAAAASLANNSTVATPLMLNTHHTTQVGVSQNPTTIAASTPSSSVTSNRPHAGADMPSPSSTSSASASASAGAAFSSGAITATITENVLNAISNISKNATPSRNMGFGVKPAPDEEKLRRVHQMVEAAVGEQAKQQIIQILDCISTLKPVEKLLLYLRLPGSSPETDPLRQPQNPLGTRSEINHTINWVRSHLEQDPHVSIPKQDVYNDYIAYCERLDIKPLSTADFGKVMKQVFPGVRPRRLGTRGHSRYCYAAMRKTTKLASPQLPQLGCGVRLGTTDEASTDPKEGFSIANDSFDEANPENWGIIKNWAESLLQTKLDNAKDLADRIKSGNMPASLLTASGSKMGITHKKFGNRETKEKRLMTDIGPLKKRRKKKRKGSSSSESSYNSQPTIKQNNCEKGAGTGTGTVTPQPITSNTQSINNVDEKPNELIKVKEEILDSPNLQRNLNITPPSYNIVNMSNNFLQQQQQMPINLALEQRSVLSRAPLSAFKSATNSSVSQYPAAKNLMPKILELAAAATATTTLGDNSKMAYQQTGTGVSLISTIKEEGIDDYSTSNILCKKVRKAQQTKGFWQQQTNPITSNKTYLSPIVVAPSTSVATSLPTATTTTVITHVVPVITTSAATPTPTENSIPVAANTPSPVGNYLMGPPATASSTSPFAAASASDSGNLTPTPKVASRNMQQLRAKRFQQAAAAAAVANEINPTADLPENLGLPRERVISICNMDKHELDDYFINGEDEDNSNDQDTELLQYFQTGGAEEKLNSLDAGKQKMIPTAATTTTRTTTITPASGQTIVDVAASLSADHLYLQQLQDELLPNVAAAETRTTEKPIVPRSTTKTTTTTPTGSLAGEKATNLLSTLITTTTTTTNTTTTATTKTVAAAITSTTMTKAVGSASASLALMSQKHQQQQQQQNIHHQQQQKLSSSSATATATATKRKIPPKAPMAKHCTFAPISPNINGSSIGGGLVAFSTNTSANGIGSASTTATTMGNGLASGGFFASPGMASARVRPKPALLVKQQSLDIDLSGAISFPTAPTNAMHDPMIGSLTRRRRNFTNNVTSASAPPSPSILHQQQQQQQHQLFNPQQFNSSSLLWQPSGGVSATNPSSSSFLIDQNSLDLDLLANSTNAGSYTNHAQGPYGGTSIDGVGGALNFDEYTSETQRSQSVPLSQLQRIHSPTMQQALSAMQTSATNNFTKNCNRPIEFSADNSLICSENSSSQHSNPTAGSSNAMSTTAAAAIIKLEDPTAADVMASDSAALLDDVDVTEILSSPDFVQHFTSIAQQQGNITAATTTCSSAGSSSGYSSSACTTLSGNIMSRSVPSTPLPHHHQNLFGQSSINFYSQRRRSGLLNDDLQLSPNNNGFINNINMKYSNKNSLNNNNIFGNSFGSRSIYDMSKSMPTTPITTPSFRYSPEGHRDFLINGNTIDDTTTSFGGVGSDSLMSSSNGGVTSVGPTVGGDDDSVNLVNNLNADALLIVDDVSVPGSDDVLLGNL